MDGYFENLVYTIETMLDSERKRHIIGGVLLSVSALFGGLSLTVITIKKGSDENDE